jgi:uroporphyrin-III C-methyltransferase / precorrin-2 dehydrogenase / sirohydrochlorin ferrochelatase
MRFPSLFTRPSAGTIVLVGSGEAALGELRVLRGAGAHVRWFSCNVDVAEEIATLAGAGRLEISVGDPLRADLSGVSAIITATGTELDRKVADRARRERIPIDVLDRPELSTSIVPAIVDRVAA